MIERLFLLSLLAWPALGNLDPQDKARLDTMLGSLQSQPPQDVPGYQKELPPEAALNDYKSLEQAGQKVFAGNEAAQILRESAEVHPYFAINDTEPLMTSAGAIIQDSKKIVKTGTQHLTAAPSFDVLVCQEPRPPLTFTCRNTLAQIHFTNKRQIYLHSVVDGWNENQTNGYRYTQHSPNATPFHHTWAVKKSNCFHRLYHVYRYEAQRQKYNTQNDDITSDEWQAIDANAFNVNSQDSDMAQDIWVHTCPHLLNKPQCRLVKKECLSKDNTRVINGKTFTRPCWMYQETYQCHWHYPNTCIPLRAQGCAQHKSTCLKKEGSECTLFEQTFHCFKKEAVSAQEIRAQEIIAEPGGDLGIKAYKQTKNYPPNAEFGDAMAKLSIFDEMKKDLGMEGSSGITPQIFKGDIGRCTKAFAGFKDCCTKMKGWGTSLGLAGCNGEDQALAQKRSQDLCVEVGEFCAEKAPVIGCIRKKRSFCCFPSKLSRIVHEQGRAQLGLSWGDGENPQCRGFSVEELSRIDFSKLDLRELHAEIASKVRAKSADTVQRNLGHRLTQMTNSLTPNSDKETY